LRWGSWTLYLDQDADGAYPTLERFQRESGIPVRYMEDLVTNDQFYGKVKNHLATGRDIGYDVVILTDWEAARWQRQGYTAPLDRTAMPNTTNLLPHLETVDYDPGRTCSMPWQGGYMVLAWNKQLVPAGMRSVDDLWDPRYAGRVQLCAELRETLGTLMLSQGVDPAGDWGEAEITDALDLVTQHLRSGQIRSITGNDYVQDLRTGDAAAVLGYSGDIAQLNFETDDAFGHTIPESGAITWTDNFVVPHTTTRTTDVQRLIDFYYDPHTAAEVAAWVNYITPVAGARQAMEELAPELVDNPLIFPDEDTLSQLVFFRTLTPDEETTYKARFLDTTGL
jgi:spermidine/putrescine transport system substrate-binding protein